MSRRYISKKDRQHVKERAKFKCEYCLVHEQFSIIGYEIDHIIPLKHGGNNNINNLAYACAICNYRKGTDIATVLLPILEPVRLFNPRLDKWADHFKVDKDFMVIPKTKVGKASIKIFQLNNIERVKERNLLIQANIYL